jgi:hypothetical protein
MPLHRPQLFRRAPLLACIVVITNQQLGGNLTDYTNNISNSCGVVFKIAP